MKLIQKHKDAYPKPHSEEVTKLALKPISANLKSMLITTASDNSNI